MFLCSEPSQKVHNKADRDGKYANYLPVFRNWGVLFKCIINRLFFSSFSRVMEKMEQEV